MELFERLNTIAGSTGTKMKIAEAMGITHQKMSAWSNPMSQRNFWEHLPKLLAAMPEISRNWLYFEEGEMFRRDNPTSGATQDQSIPPHAGERIEHLTETIRQQSETIHQQAETIRKLTDELLSIRRTA